MTCPTDEKQLSIQWSKYRRVLIAEYKNIAKAFRTDTRIIDLLLRYGGIQNLKMMAQLQKCLKMG